MKFELNEVKKCIAWAAQQGYTHAEKAAKELEKIIKKKCIATNLITILIVGGNRKHKNHAKNSGSCNGAIEGVNVKDYNKIPYADD